MLLILVAILPVYFSRLLSYHHIIIIMLIITQISCITQHSPSSLYWSTAAGTHLLPRVIPATAEFHLAGAGFLHHSLADFQSDILN